MSLKLQHPGETQLDSGRTYRLCAAGLKLVMRFKPEPSYCEIAKLTMLAMLTNAPPWCYQNTIRNQK